jgi:hypothetical protein
MLMDYKICIAIYSEALEDEPGAGDGFANE